LSVGLDSAVGRRAGPCGDVAVGPCGRRIDIEQNAGNKTVQTVLGALIAPHIEASRQ
jgi:hypothetical protein